jgi:hypothetical protein
MPKIVVEGPDGRKFAFPDTMPRAEINAFMKQKYGTKAPNESVQDYLARFGREQAATEARVKDIDREATAVGRAEGERAAERMGVDNPLMMAFAAPAIGLAQQEGGRRVFEREGTVLADEAAGLSAINAAGFFVPGMVNREFGARVEEGRRQQPLAAFAGDVAGGFGPGEIIGAGVSKAVQAIGPGMAALGRMLSRGPGPDTTNAIVGGTLGGIAPAETAEERARNVAVGAGLGYVARPASQAVDRVSDRVLGSGNPNLKGVDKKRQAYTFDVGGAKAKVTFEESFPDDGDYPRRVPTDIARLREDVRQEYLTPLRALDRSVETIVPDRYNRAALGPTGPTRTLQDSVNVEMDISNANLTLPQAKQLFEKTFDTFEDHAIRHRRPVYYFTGAKPSQQTLYENSIKRRGAPKGYVATTGPDGFYFVRDDLFQNFAKELQDDGYDVITRTASNPRATAEAVPAGGYFNRQSMRPPGSGPSPREIETQQQWSTATPIVTQARTTAQTAQQAAEAALQSKAPADIARAKDQKKALVGQLQKAQASRAGMDTPEDARLSETLASLTENTSDPVLLSTQISAAKTSLDRLLTDIGSPVEGNLIPVRTQILTRTQAPRSAAEGPQDRASVTRYAEGSDEIKPQGFGAGGPEGPKQADYRGRHLSPDKESGAPLHEVNSNGIYPDDVYSPKGLRYYGTATSDAMDRKAFELIQSMRGKPDATVTIYRAVPTNIEQSAMQINPNDWVTISKDYAKYHGDSVLRGDYKIVSKEVKAKDIYTAGDSWLEWGWSPEKLDDLPPISPMGFGASTPKTPQQAARFETPGSPEYEAAVAKGLDMSTPARMARAKEMGFDTDTVLYHGTSGDVKAFGRDTYLASDRRYSEDWIEGAQDGQIKEVYIKGRKYPADEEETQLIFSDIQILTQGEQQARRSLLRNIENEGYDYVYSPINGGETLVFDPSNIRSVNAAFDPEKSTSSTLLAASPFAAVSGAGLTSERELGARMADDTIRADGTKKGTGFLGPLKRPDGMTMTEYSVGVNIDGKDVEIPTLVPTLTQDEIDSLLNLPDGDKPPRAIINKAIDHARNRIKNNKSPFWNPQDDGQPTPKKKD